jgi:hypothetical protein
MSKSKKYAVALMREEDGRFEVVEYFDEDSDEAAIRYCEQEYSGEAWYLLDSEGRDVNGGVR